MRLAVRASARQWAQTLTGLLADYPLVAVAAGALSVLDRTGQHSLVPLIRQALRDAARHSQVCVESAYELSARDQDQMAARLAKRFPGQAIVFAVRPELVGGLRIRIGSTLIEYSAAGLLGQLATHLREDNL